MEEARFGRRDGERVGSRVSNHREPVRRGRLRHNVTSNGGGGEKLNSLEEVVGEDEQTKIKKMGRNMMSVAPQS